MTREKAQCLVAENMKILYAWALSRVSNKEDAEDLAGDTMLAVIENAHRLKCDDAFFGWFWQVARNTYSNFLKKRKKHSCSDLDSTVEPQCEDTPESITVKKETVCALHRELALLAKNHRRCSVDYYFNELSVKDIAEKYSLTPENVKYYLFKTRKILKEGIAMERQFGEKSFNPAPFTLRVAFCGNKTEEYENLFEKRKLPGQVLTSAYYSPMSISELCIELGVPAVYLEDEIKVLCDYGFLKKTGADKYQTQIIIMDEGFFAETVEKCKREYAGRVSSVCHSLKEKLSDVKAMGFAGSDLDRDLLLWDILVLAMASGYDRAPKNDFSQKICRDTIGLCYGFSCDINDVPVKRKASSMAFFYNNGAGQKAAVLGFDKAFDFSEVDKLCAVYKKDPQKTEIPVFSKEEWDDLIWNILNAEGDRLCEVIRGCTAICAESMRNRAPEGLSVEEDTFIHAVIMIIFSIIADICEENGVVYPDEAKHPGVIALKC